MRTAEIRAYNYGRRTRAAGVQLAAFFPATIAYAVVPFAEAEAEAETELGARAFGAWAVRGWVESVNA